MAGFRCDVIMAAIMIYGLVYSVWWFMVLKGRILLK